MSDTNDLMYNVNLYENEHLNPCLAAYSNMPLEVTDYEIIAESVAAMPSYADSRYLVGQKVNLSRNGYECIC